ncbi:MAG: histone deacetylase [Thermoplasmata archaeon]|nr:MAG: histone deacetylase [Thermoplasmata archaeon]
MTVMVMTDKNKTAIIYNSSHIGHKPGTSSPENPERLTSIMDFLENEAKVFDHNCVLIKDFEPAREEDALLVHEMRYIDFMKKYCKRGGGFLGDSTYLTKGSFEHALLAVGGAIKASELVLQRRFDTSFALIRPPGHHASKDRHGGYCILNNAAILARYLQNWRGLKKIMIVDWDAHAADGTMKIFYEDPTVVTISLHQDPIDFYPHNGFMRQIGAREGRGTNINVVLPKTSGDDEYLLAIEEIVLPIFHQFSPDFVIGCNGFDAHFSEQNTNLRMTCEGYYDLVKKLKEEMTGKFTILMEGGYTKFNGKLTHSIIAALTGKDVPYTKEIDIRSDSLFKEGTPRKTFEKNLKNIKQLLLGFYKL